jgi:hypothetical protein
LPSRSVANTYRHGIEVSMKRLLCDPFSLLHRFGKLSLCSTTPEK